MAQNVRRTKGPNNPGSPELGRAGDVAIPSPAVIEGWVRMEPIVDSAYGCAMNLPDLAPPLESARMPAILHVNYR